MARVDIQVERGVARVLLSRPERRNAIDLAMWDAIAAAFGSLHGQDGIRCILLGSAVSDLFSVGADLDEFREIRRDAEGARRYEARMRPAVDAVRTCRHPVVARLGGPCLGGGMELALHADIRIAGRSLRCGIPVNRTGQLLPIPDLEGLVAAVGIAVAKELILEGRVLDASEALAKGIVSRVVPDADLESAADDAVERIAAGSPRSARWHKAVLGAVASGSVPSVDPDDVFRSADTGDYREGLAAFFAKRAPSFPA